VATSNCVRTTLDDEETEPVKLYTTTTAHTIKYPCVNDNYIL